MFDLLMAPKAGAGAGALSVPGSSYSNPARLRGGSAADAAIIAIADVHSQGRQRPANRQSDMRRLGPGQALYHAGDPADWVYEVISGCIKIDATTSDGRQLVVDFLMPGDLAGLAAGAYFGNGAEAVGETFVRPIGRGQLLSALRDDPRAADALLQMAGRREAALQRHLLLLGIRHAPARLATFLLSMAERRNNTGDAASIRLPMLKRDIALHLSMAPETLCRATRQLCDAGLINQHDRGEIEIPSLRVLAALATQG